MIPTYNLTDYLPQTLNSVLSEYKGADQMQIEVVDDCSTNVDVGNLVLSLGGGHVSFHRLPANVQIPRIFTECVRRARGHFVHVLHSDDYVLPGFYEKLQVGLESSESIGLAFCRHRFIDNVDRGMFVSESFLNTAAPLPNFKTLLALRNLIQTPSVAVKRSVYERLGGFDTNLSHAADWEMWMRIAAHYNVWFEPEFLACYRLHDSSDTSKLMRTGANIADCRRALATFERYLDEPSKAGKILEDSRLSLASYGLSTARRMLRRKDLSAAAAQTREALKCIGTFTGAYKLCEKIVRKLQDGI